MAKGYKGVWVVAEQRDEKLQKVSLELLGKARELAQKKGEKVTVLLLGYKIERLSQDLIDYGADEVLVFDHELLKNYTTDAYTKVICDIAKERKPDIILTGATYIGRDLGPRVAARLRTGLTADCTGLDIDEVTGNLLMTRPAFGGNLMATIECPDHRPQMSTVRAGVFSSSCLNVSKKGSVEFITPVLNEEDIRTKVEEIVKSLKENFDITEADVVVAGGGGIGNKEGFKLLRALSDVLGGVVGASRAAVDAGWIEKDYQVGQTGKTVRPKLYIACGISGQIQHLAGMQESNYIIAINKDDSAPIMNAADIAIVGDVYKIVPEMVKEIEKLKYSSEL